MQKQDIQNKVNSKRSTRFGGLEELATDQIVYIYDVKRFIYII